MNIQNLVRKNIAAMKPYSSARDEFSGEAEVYLDANENPYLSPYNRYPDPLQKKVREALGKYKKIAPENIFLGNGSDEAIDLLIRSFCEPNRDSILVLEPTYGMYTVCATINAVFVQSVSLTSSFDIDLTATKKAIDAATKIIFICSPNNPSGNLLNRDSIINILETFSGIVVIDEAYIDFSVSESFLQSLSKYQNLVILQTFSKAWGLAGLRLGMCYASSEIIAILNKVKYPYNINIQTQTLVLKALANEAKKNSEVKQLIEEREKLIKALINLPQIEQVFPSEANFVLVKVNNAKKIYEGLMSKGIIVRDRSSVLNCANCIRITIGTLQENQKLLTTLKEI
jgi:histidinol-phosphate aminotransferase